MTQYRHSNELDALSRWEAIFTALRAEPRRELLLSLRSVGADQSVPLPRSAVGKQSRRNIEAIELELIHHHLPLLADNHFIEWEKQPFQATRGPRFEEILSVVELLMANASFVPESLRLTSLEALSNHQTESAN